MRFYETAMITLGMSRKKARYPCDLTDIKWLFFAPYLILMRQSARRSEYPSRKLNNGLRNFVKAGCWWRLPPLWTTACQRCHLWLRVGNSEAMAYDLSEIPPVASDCQDAPAATVPDDHTVRSTSESGVRPGYDGYSAERDKKGSKTHITRASLYIRVSIPQHQKSRFK